MVSKIEDKIICIVGLGYVWVCIYSKLMLKEKMTFLKWIGILIVILGVSFIGFGA